MSNRLGSAALSVLLVSALAGCGVGESSDSEAASGDALKACMSKAAELKQSKSAESPLKVLAPFPMSKNKGKSIWIINAARVPLLQRASDGAEAAAAAAGMTAKVVYGDGSTNAAQAAVQQAIAQGADGIALAAIDPSTIQNSVDQAHQAGIVVTDVGNRNIEDDLRPGVAGQLGYDVPKEMAAIAGWIMTDSTCSANTLMYSPSALSITSASAKAFQSSYEGLCSSCTFELKDLDYGSFASTLTPEVQTDIRRNPDLNYIFAIIGSSVPNVDAGLRGNDRVRVLTRDGLDDNLNALRKGDTHVVADFAYAPNDALGWQVVDQLGRLMQGEDDAAKLTLPSRMVDASNIGSTNEDIWPSFKGYQDAYTATWN